ncbi:phosphotransferase family protein [Sphingopyxis sp. GW247-27LB]|uniref:phosphotransferase family protein n=1 Tax=Sphingopyxis sp. GW247-27LB TaxID=2012632 RepID=UPI000BA7CF17|nr:phosphotransferase family protein [Sphingopyxis sp. GW247-27LB]PAL24227.1 phosphotransferase family protein [Sphingopyxis sp. GW247-27LB]
MATHTADQKALVNLAALESWMDEQGLEQGAIGHVAKLAGGTQNVILRFRRGERDFVLRRPPPNPRPESNETMRREARVLQALGTTNVPHPRLIAACGDIEPLGTSFYLMEPIDGFNATSGLPSLHANSAEIRHRMGLAIVEGAAALGSVDYRAVGLSDFGKPDNYLARQVSRWQSQLAGYERYEGWPGVAGLPGVDVISNYLDSHCPSDFHAGIIHGDYSLGNVMYRNDGPELAAIIDWELATIGDPLIDLGWLLATWRGVPPVDLSVLVVEPWQGFPAPEELVAHYAAHSDRDLSAIDWYMILACFKLGIILEGTFARACAGRDPMDTGLALHETASRLFRRALHRIG